MRACAQNGLAVWREGIHHSPSTIRMPWFLDMVSEIFVRVLEFCKLRCSTSGSSLDEAPLALERRTWKARTVIFSMASANTKFLPLASTGSSTTRALFPLFRDDAIFTSS